MNRLAPSPPPSSLPPRARPPRRSTRWRPSTTPTGPGTWRRGTSTRPQHRFELALEYNPDYPSRYNNLCLVWIKRANFDKAKDLCIKALRLNNDFAEAHNNLGYIYLQEKSYGKAHDAFKNALKVNPGYIEARYNLCLTYLRSSGPRTRASATTRSSRPTPTSPTPTTTCACSTWSRARSRTRSTSAARPWSSTPSSSTPGSTWGRAYQGAASTARRRRPTRAASRSTSPMRVRNNLAAAHRQCALTAPDLKEIKDDAAKENSPATLYKLGLAEREKGLVPEAERRFKKCIKLDGRFGLCHCALAEMARQEARNDEGQGELQEVPELHGRRTGERRPRRL